jgi:hypothetical protein
MHNRRDVGNVEISIQFGLLVAAERETHLPVSRGVVFPRSPHLGSLIALSPKTVSRDTSLEASRRGRQREMTEATSNASRDCAFDLGRGAEGNGDRCNHELQGGRHASVLPCTIVRNWMTLS